MRRLIVLPVLVLLVFAGAGRASAHTDLEKAVPAEGAVVTSALRMVELTFSSDVQPEFTQIAVTGSDGRSSAAGTATVEGPLVRQPVDVSSPGTYTVAYRIVSTDGHPVEGKYRFTYRGDGTVDAEPTPDRTEAAPPEPSAVPPANVDEKGSASWSWAGILAGVAVAAGLVAVLARRRRRVDD